LKLYDAMADAFVAEGVTDIFGMTGDTNIRVISSLAERGTSFYQVRHEGAGLAMADGWARMRGTPGVCTTTGGPGATQLATTMMVASRARTPLVAFCGDTSTGDQNDAQYIEQQRFAAAIEAGYVRIHSADDMYESVQKAFYQARLESRPIMLSLPLELAKADVSDLDEYVPSGDLLATRRAVYPHPEAIAQAADIIGQSERPVIIAGRGAMRSGAGAEVERLANRIGAVIAVTLMAKNWLGEHPYHVGLSGLFATKTAIELFQEADCVIAIGASMNQYTTEHGYLFPGAKFVQIDPKPHILMGDGRSADCYVQSDAKLGVDALETALAGHTSIGFHTEEVSDRLNTAWDDSKPYELPAQTLDPRDAVAVLDDAMPAEIGMILGGGQQNHFGIMHANKQRSWLLPNLHFACIGQGLTTAIGGVIATGTPGFLMEGDAGFMMHLGEFETAVRYQIPLLVAVMNDEGYAAEYHPYVDTEEVDINLVTVASADLGAVGRALGGSGALVRTPEELRGAVANFVATPSPTLLDIRIARNVASIPNRRRHYGEADQ
jgi:thiamine pyrophosphate-dependent acetolactate synthase large subunit-like protein